MKCSFIIIGIALSLVSFPQKIVVFGKNNFCDYSSDNSQCKPGGPEEIKFLADLSKQENLTDADLCHESLVTPPLEWGSKVSDTTYGKLDYFSSFPHGFVCKIKLFNLIPSHKYLLTLNGNPKLPGNDLLPDTVPNMSIEKYYDFLAINTDRYGNYKAKIAVFLIPGIYQARFYLKDTNGYKIVLYHDYFKFIAGK